MNGKNLMTERTFREFLNFYSDLKHTNPDTLFPLFPNKQD